MTSYARKRTRKRWIGWILDKLIKERNKTEMEAAGSLTSYTRKERDRDGSAGSLTSYTRKRTRQRWSGWILDKLCKEENKKEMERLDP